MEEGEREGETGNLNVAPDEQPSLQCVQDLIDAKMLNTVPALKLFTSALTKRHCDMGVASSQAPPTSTSHSASLESHRETVVYSLHLVYEVQCDSTISRMCHCMSVYFYL